MNRSVLIAVCDFLILSLLSIASFQGSMLDKKSGTAIPETDISVHQDILDSINIVMEEQLYREKNLKSSLSEMESSLTNKKEEKIKLENKINELTNTNAELKNIIASSENELADKATKLVQIQATLEIEKERSQNLEQSIGILTKDLNVMQEKLKTSTDEYNKSLQDIGSLSAKADMNKQVSSELKDELEKIKQEKLLQEKEFVSLQKQLDEAQTGQADFDRLAEEKKALELQTRDLAQSMAKIAADSLKIQARQEVLSNNDLFAQFLDTKVTVQFKAKRKLLFKTFHFSQNSAAVAISSGEQIVFLFHINDSLLDWFHFEKINQFQVNVILDDKEYLLSGAVIEVLNADPHLFMVRVNKTALPEMKVFEIEQDFAKFDDALLIKVNEAKYESFKWNLVPGDSNLFLVPSSISSRIFGKFAPDPGDLILSRNGNVLGVMLTQAKAFKISDLSAKEIFVSGDTIDAQKHLTNYKQWRNRRFQNTF